MGERADPAVDKYIRDLPVWQQDICRAQWAGSTLAWPLDIRQLSAMLTEASAHRRRHLVAGLGSTIWPSDTPVLR